MTTSPRSGSEETAVAAAPPSTAYHLYHPKVQKWIYSSGWDRLRDAQERAAAPILAGRQDVIIGSATANGKTEAAWLPVCSALLRRREAGECRPGIQALAISPLKALINDQYDRISQLCERLDLPVHRWHGDVPSAHKSSVIRAPEGILLITPESLEALFVNHGSRILRVVGDLRYVVVDELHCFIGTERGAQLQSLLHRIELSIRRQVPRIALSATLSDFGAAAEFLRPGHGSEVVVVASTDDAGEIRLQVRGCLAAAPGKANPRIKPAGDVVETSDKASIADHLFRVLHTGDNLIFANSRAAVETYADMLERRRRAAGSRSEFLAHHGSLAREIREHVESRLKDPATPVTAICTSTMEMGIDVGSVDSIAQVGAPPTVSSLRQRLGRSGRRPGQPAVLRVYIAEPELTAGTPPPDALRDELIQSIAMIELLLATWYEPPDTAGLHLSTLIQQILSLLAQHGGAPADQVYRTLCVQGPFARVQKPTFVTLLRDMGSNDLIQHDSRGWLLPGVLGDRLVNHYSFYAAFHTSQDYKLVTAGRTLGSLPVDRPILPGTQLIFNGARWRVVTVDNAKRIIELTSSGDGRPPVFPGSGGEVADEVRRAMKGLYRCGVVPRYLDRTAEAMLGEGRAAFHRLGLAHRSIIGWGSESLLFPWRGDRIMNTLAVTLTGQGLHVGQHGVCLTVGDTTPTTLWKLMKELAQEPPPDPLDIARTVRVKTHDKYDRYLSDDLLNRAYAARALDVPGAWTALSDLTAARPRPA